MALISPEEFKKSRGQQSTVGGGSIQSGLIPPSEFKQRAAALPLAPPSPPTRSELTRSGLLPPIDAIRSSPVVQQATAVAPPEPKPQAPGRNIPVVGQVLRGLDTVRDNPVRTFLAEKVFLPLYTPGGGLANIASFTGATGNALNRIAPKLGTTTGGRIAQEAIKEGAAGAPLAAGQTLSSQSTDLGEVAKQGAIGGALGAAGGAAVAAVGPRLSAAVGKWLQRKGMPAEQVTEILSPTAPTAPAMPDKPLALPEPNVAPPTKARIERQSNPYRQQFEDLISRAKQLESEGYFTPGREDIELESLWSQMAGKDAPNLDRLIDLAYPKTQNRVQPDLARRAREYQQTRQAAGVPLPVRSMDERYPSGPVAPAAAPVSKLREVDVPVPEAAPVSASVDPLGFSAFGKEGKFTNPEDTRTYIATKTEREPINFDEAVRAFYTKNVDSLQPINQMDKYIEQQTGKKLKPNERAYMLALNNRGADVISNHILTQELVNARGDVIGPSLKSITEQIPRRSYKNFNDYLIAKHAETRMARGETVYDRKTNMTPDKVAAKIAEYERTYPEFKSIAEQLYAWNDKMVQTWLVDTGIISSDMAAAWKKENPYWVPNQRKFTELEKQNQSRGAKRGFANQRNPVRKYSPTGSERAIIDPFESLIEYTDRYVKTAKRNEVMQTVVKNLEKDPEAFDGFATVLKREKVDPKTALGDEGASGLLNSLDEEFDRALKKSDLDKDNVVSVLMGGERVYVRVNDPALLEALTNLNPQASKSIVEATRKVTNAMKLLTTGINPIFGLTRNIFRDIPEAYIYSKTTDNPFTFAWDALEGFVSVFAEGASGAIGKSKLTPESFRKFLDSRAELYRSYKRVGGGHSSPAAANRNLLAQSKRSLLPQQQKGLGLLRRSYNVLENLNNALESAPRLGEFKRSTKAGKDSYGSRVRGLYEAQDITTNFKRSGQVVKEADAIFPYLNAAVQGLDKFVRAFKDRPAAVASKAVGAIVAPTVALYALNHDNPEYKKLSNFTKDNFYLIPTTDGKFVKIPKPRELGVPFGGLVERAMRAWSKDDPEAFRDFAATARTMFAPPVVGSLLEGKNPLRDTVAGPLVELSSNENFMGVPIVPGYLEGLSPRHQYDANTSEVSKKIGDLINVSPKQIDHLIRSYTGVVGQIGLPATTQGASVKETLTKQVTADPVFSTDASKYFYELKTKLDTQYKDAKATGNVPKGYDDGVRKYLDRVADQMSDYTRAIRAIDGMDLTPEEKKNQKRELTDARNEFARQAYAAALEAVKQSK